jgi:hypothetical protein
LIFKDAFEIKADSPRGLLYVAENALVPLAFAFRRVEVEAVGHDGLGLLGLTLTKNSPLRGAWFKGVSEDVNRAPESVFFYWLGHHTLNLAWAVPYYQSQGWTKDANDLIASSATDFLDFSTNTSFGAIFGALTPQVQNAITFIAAAKKKFSNPPNPFDKSGQTGLTPDDISKIVDAAKQIRAAAQANQLTK